MQVARGVNEREPHPVTKAHGLFTRTGYTCRCRAKCRSLGRKAQRRRARREHDCFGRCECSGNNFLIVKRSRRQEYDYYAGLMKWLTPLLPYLAVAIGIFWVRNALVALLSFHAAILAALLLGRTQVPVSILFTSRNFRWVILSVLLCGSSGVSLYFFWAYFEVIGDISAHIESFGLTSSTWPIFIAYFVLVNPLVEE